MHTITSHDFLPTTHGERIDIKAASLRSRFLLRDPQHTRIKLPKSERVQFMEFVAQCESNFTRNGVDFSRVDIGSLRQHERSGGAIEFETLGPYLQSYLPYGGVMSRDTLITEDAIGLELAVALRTLFPKGRLISLYDDYNTHSPSCSASSTDTGIGAFSAGLKKTFRQSLIELYMQAGALTEQSVETIDYLMISESSTVDDAETLVARLEAKGYIYRKNNEIIFTNNRPENPLYHTIHLRNARGKWLCEALDAATFLKDENYHILHIVALPSYMKAQQDKVWEILRVLGISPHKYHNIFYDLDYSPSSIAATVLQTLRSGVVR